MDCFESSNYNLINKCFKIFDDCIQENKLDKNKNCCSELNFCILQQKDEYEKIMKCYSDYIRNK